MIDGLKEDYFSKSGGVSQLSLSLLLPGSSANGENLAEYHLIKSKRDEAEEAGNPIRFRPSKVNRKKLSTKEFDHWFEEIADGKFESLTKPDTQFNQLVAKDPALKAVNSYVHKPLREGLKYHCFLSYKQSSAIDIVGKQYYVLANRGYKCWYDQQFQGQITLENMQQGVRDSMVYILFLSKDIFPSYFVEEEVKMAVKLNKPIFFMHHPATGELGYWQFSDYVKNAPEVLKPFFSTVESLELQRRHYLEEAVTEVLDQRLQAIMKAKS